MELHAVLQGGSGPLRYPHNTPGRGAGQRFAIARRHCRQGGRRRTERAAHPGRSHTGRCTKIGVGTRTLQHGAVEGAGGSVQALPGSPGRQRQDNQRKCQEPPNPSLVVPSSENHVSIVSRKTVKRFPQPCVQDFYSAASDSAAQRKVETITQETVCRLPKTRL